MIGKNLKTFFNMNFFIYSIIYVDFFIVLRLFHMNTDNIRFDKCDFFYYVAD